MGPFCHWGCGFKVGDGSTCSGVMLLSVIDAVIVT